MLYWYCQSTLGAARVHERGTRSRDAGRALSFRTRGAELLVCVQVCEVATRIRPLRLRHYKNRGGKWRLISVAFVSC